MVFMISVRKASLPSAVYNSSYVFAERIVITISSISGMRALMAVSNGLIVLVDSSEDELLRLEPACSDRIPAPPSGEYIYARRVGEVNDLGAHGYHESFTRYNFRCHHRFSVPSTIAPGSSVFTTGITPRANIRRIAGVLVHQFEWLGQFIRGKHDVGHRK